VTDGVLARLLSRARTDLVVMDGGMGTTLEDRGTHCRSALWSSFALVTEEGLALTGQVHAEYAAAGAEILIANTHNAGLSACRAFLEGDGPTDPLPDEVRRAAPERRPEAFLAWVHRRAVESARAAVPENASVAVAAGVGSAEGAYATESRLRPEQVAAELEPQVRALLDLNVDLILFETLTPRSEIEAAADLSRRLGVPAYGAGLTCGGDGRTLAGVTMRRAWEALAAWPPAAVFIQCTRYDYVQAALAGLVEAMDDGSVPGVYANDGRIWRNRIWHGERVTPEAYAEEALAWRDAGAGIIGGCCGTSPEHVAALVRRLRA
jgi:enediyne biosynthesis protein CalE2